MNENVYKVVTRSGQRIGGSGGVHSLRVVFQLSTANFLEDQGLTAFFSALFPRTIVFCLFPTSVEFVNFSEALRFNLQLKYGVRVKVENNQLAKALT